MPSIAILGASADRSKFGNKAVRAFHSVGYTVYPVNPKGGTIEGHRVFTSLRVVPESNLDMISVYLPPHLGLQALDEIAMKRVSEVWFNPGAESDEILERARELGLNAIAACSLVGNGLSPSKF